MCYRKLKCREKRVVPHSAHLPPANISNSIHASKVNRIYLKWVKFFFQMCHHLLWKQWKSLLGFCLSKSPALFALVRKASALTCGSLIPKMWDNIVNETENAGARLEASQTALECNLKRPLSLSLLLNDKGEIATTSQSWEGDERHWQVESASPGVSWKSSSWRLWVFTLDEMPYQPGEAQQNWGLLGDTVSRNHEKDMCMFGKLEGDWQEQLASQAAWKHS